VVTTASVWIVRPEDYLRLPRNEAPREAIEDLDGATRDAMWHRHDGVWLLEDIDVLRLNVLPSGRPEGSRGIYTGPIEQMAGG
jgi:hypothetical protein